MEANADDPCPFSEPWLRSSARRWSQIASWSVQGSAAPVSGSVSIWRERIFPPPPAFPLRAVSWASKLPANCCTARWVFWVWRVPCARTTVPCCEACRLRRCSIPSWCWSPWIQCCHWWHVSVALGGVVLSLHCCTTAEICWRRGSSDGQSLLSVLLTRCMRWRRCVVGSCFFAAFLFCSGAVSFFAV